MTTSKRKIKPGHANNNDSYAQAVRQDFKSIVITMFHYVKKIH